MKDYLKIEPESLVAEIARPRLIKCLGIAAAATIVFIIITSVFFIIDCFKYGTIYPVKAEREAVKLAEEQAAAKKKAEKEKEAKAAAEARKIKDAEQKAKQEQALQQVEADLNKNKQKQAPAAQQPAAAGDAAANPAAPSFGTLEDGLSL